jgi:hypothetical protein
VNDEKTCGFGVDSPLGYVGATYLIGRRGLNEHVTQRAKGWLHCSRATGLLLAGESGCTVELLGRP